MLLLTYLNSSTLVKTVPNWWRNSMYVWLLVLCNSYWFNNNASIRYDLWRKRSTFSYREECQTLWRKSLVAIYRKRFIIHCIYKVIQWSLHLYVERFLLCTAVTLMLGYLSSVNYRYISWAIITLMKASVYLFMVFSLAIYFDKVKFFFRCFYTSWFFLYQLMI